MPHRDAVVGRELLSPVGLQRPLSLIGGSANSEWGVVVKGNPSDYIGLQYCRKSDYLDLPS